MLQISSRAAALIQDQCDTRNLGGAAGMRVYAPPETEERKALRLRYVPEPHPGDHVVEKGPARVFLAEEVVGLVSPYVLDAIARDQGAERLVLRPDA